MNPRIRNFNHLFSSSLQSIYIRLRKCVTTYFFNFAKVCLSSAFCKLLSSLNSFVFESQVVFSFRIWASPLSPVNKLTSPISLFASATFLFMVHCVLCEVLLQKGKFYWTSAHCVGQYRVMWVAIFGICSLEPWLYFWG